MPTDTSDDWPDAPLLIVDDDEAWVAMLTQALRSMGWEDIRSLTDPEHAAAIAREFKPAVILLDLRMATKTGLDVLDDLQEIMPEVPVIMVTCVEDVELTVTCMRKGACHYLIKPLRRDKLREALHTALADESHFGHGQNGEHSLADLAELPQLKEVKDLLIEEALRRTDGTLREAADMLGITPQAICNRRRRAADAEDALRPMLPSSEVEAEEAVPHERASPN